MMRAEMTRARRLRLLAGLTGVEVARQAGISRQSLWILEFSGRATPAIAARVAAALQVEPRDILGIVPARRGRGM